MGECQMIVPAQTTARKFRFSYSTILATHQEFVPSSVAVVPISPRFQIGRVFPHAIGSVC